MIKVILPRFAHEHHVPMLLIHSSACHFCPLKFAARTRFLPFLINADRPKSPSLARMPSLSFESKIFEDLRSRCNPHEDLGDYFCTMRRIDEEDEDLQAVVYEQEREDLTNDVLYDNLRLITRITII